MLNKLLKYLKKAVLYGLVDIRNIYKLILWCMQTLNLIWETFKKLMDPDESYIDKYEDRIACSYRLTCVDDRFSEPVYIKSEMHFISLLIKYLKNLSIVKELQKTIKEYF